MTNEARISARLDALRRNRASEEQLGQLIQEELSRAPARERERLLRYFERWLDRQFEILLAKEASPATALRLCMERLAPAPKDSPIDFR